MRNETVRLPRAMAVDYLVHLDRRRQQLAELPAIYDAEPRIHEVRRRMEVVERALGVTLDELRALSAERAAQREASHA